MEINFVAVLVATIAVFALGGIWYGPIFGKAWAREANHDPTKAYPAAQVYGLAFVFNVIAAVAFGSVVGPAPGLHPAIHLGLIIGICFVALSFAINYQAATRSFKMLLIDGGFHVVRFLLFGVVFGLLG